MPLSPTEGTVLAAYAGKALEAMRTATERVDDDDLNRRPFGDDTNAVAALVVHSVAVCEFWLGHVALGRPSDRQRDGEFGAVAGRAELHAMIDGCITQTGADIARLAAEGGRPSEIRAFLAGDESDLSLIIHVLEELFQHLGHLEITADALTA